MAPCITPKMISVLQPCGFPLQLLSVCLPLDRSFWIVLKYLMPKEFYSFFISSDTLGF